MKELHAPHLDLTALPVLPGTAATTKAGRRMTRRIEKRRFARLEQHRAAIQHLDPLPRGPGEVLHVVMDGRFSTWDLIAATIELIGEPVTKLTISTLGTNRRALDALIELRDSGAVEAITLNLSHYFRSTDREIFADIKRELESRGDRVGVSRSHAKLALIRSASRAIVIETSGNLRSSMNYEQATISDCPALYDFHVQWITELSTEEPQ